MRIRGPHAAVFAAAASAALMASAALAAEGQVAGLTVTPARTHGTAAAGAAFGPIGLRNTTAQEFKVRVKAVLLAQDRQGGLLARDDPRSVARASRYVAFEGKKASLGPGGVLSRSITLRRPTSRHNFYGGLLWEAMPRRDAKAPQILAIYQLNEALLLRPPPPLQKIRLRAEGLRAETAGRNLRVLLALENRGNTDVVPRGRITVRDARGRLVVARPLRLIDIIPGAVVDLPAIIKKRLPAGSYTLAARVTAQGRSVRAKVPLRLFGVNEVETRDARLTEFDDPTAYIGEAIDVHARFKNTGNVPYAPHAEVSAKRVAPKPGPHGRLIELDVDEADPGQEGSISGSLELPESAGAYELNLQIREGSRVLDTRAVTVNPVPKPSILVRTKNWAIDHVVGVIGVMFGGMLALVAALIYATDPRRR